MAATLHGDHTASVPRHVDLESKVVSELVPIHHRVAGERIVRAKTLRADNAILSIVQVRCSIDFAENLKVRPSRIDREIAKSIQ